LFFTGKKASVIFIETINKNYKKQSDDNNNLY